MNLRIKDYTSKVGSGVTPKGGAESYLSSGIPLFRSQNVHNFGFLLDDIAYISEEIDEQMSGSRVMPGDVLLNITGASIGRCYFTSDDFKGGNVNQHVCIIRPNQKVVKPAFLHYLLISDKGQMYIDLSQTGANRQGLTIEEIRNFSFDIPTIKNQLRIVDYLDNQLAAIDHRVEVLENEKDAYARLKKSVINQAVTRGLNPNVTLKDSGIDWIGMIPEHWEVKRIKDIGKLKLGKMLDEKPKDGYHLKPYLKSKNIGWNELKLDEVEEMFFNESEMSLLRLQKGDLVLSEGGEVGKTALWNKELEECYIQNSVQKLTVNEKGSSKYYLYLSCLLGQIGYYKSIVNLVSIMHLTFEKLRQVIVLCPPLKEQQAIAAYLDEKCAKIDAAIDNISKQIDASKRLKKAVINEAISGKVKL